MNQDVEAANSGDWSELIAHICRCTGWTWREVEYGLDLPRAQALMAYWRQHPPTHQLLGLLAEWAGAWKLPVEGQKSTPEADMPYEFLQSALAAGGVFTGTTDHSPAQG